MLIHWFAGKVDISELIIGINEIIGETQPGGDR